MNPSLKETIVAVATPPGEGAIGIVRLSGPEALPIAGRIFTGRSRPSSKPLEPFRLTLGYLRHPSGGEAIDEVLAVSMPEPRSYTGEDVVEFQAHGGRAVLEGALAAAVAAGARPAHPGEFTKRAFLNGRLDLSQAEAVIDLIRSRSGAARRAALAQLEGNISRRIDSLQESIRDAASRMEAELDFGEEEIGEDFHEGLLDGPIDLLKSLLAGEAAGETLRKGIEIAVCGRKNVGKSSLANCLLDAERSIVTSEPGTTRDIVESPLCLAGCPALLVDTAGLGDSTDTAENEGIRRSRERLGEAALIVAVFDSSRDLNRWDHDLLRAALKRASLVVLNKSDLPAVTTQKGLFSLAEGKKIHCTSAKTGEGIGRLREALGEAVSAFNGVEDEEQPVLITARHADTLSRALEALERSREGLGTGLPLELAATDLRKALSILGEITGETATEDLLERIFSRFCIGK